MNDERRTQKELIEEVKHLRRKIAGTNNSKLDRKQAEEELKLRAEMLNQARDGIILSDLEGNLLYANDIAVKERGYTLEEFLKLNTRDLVVAETGSGDVGEWFQEVRAKGYHHIRFSIRSKDGSVIPMDAMITKIMLGDKEYVLSVTRNITERKKVDEELDLRARMLDQSTDGIMLHDLEGNFVYVNDTVLRERGYTREEFLKMNVRDVVTAEHFNKVKRWWHDVADTESRHEEVEIRRKDDSLFSVEVHSGKVNYRGQEYILSSTRNITERKLAEKALRSSEERMRLFMDSATDAFSIWDSKLNLVDCNETRMRLYFPGLKKEEVIGKNMKELFPHLVKSERYKQYLKVLKTGKPYSDDDTVSYVNDISVLDSDRRHISIRAFKVGEGLGVINADITERIKAEEELRKYRDHLEVLIQERTTELEQRSEELTATNIRLEEMSRHKSQFLANMSHELRTPLNSIIGYTKLILNGMDGEINEDQTQDLQTVYNNSKHLLELINDLLDLSKIEAGKTVLTYEMFSISDVLSEVIPTMEQLARAKGLTLTYSIIPDISNLYADKTRTNQILINLLGNAVKFTSEGSIKLDITETDSDFIFSVTDTGIGMKKEDLEQIFESFNQIGSTQIAGYESTGLGLAISKQFVEMMGGKIWAKSKLGKGSTLTFTLPKKNGS